jgi:capsular exopolysaccharide synthesis family protein
MVRPVYTSTCRLYLDNVNLPRELANDLIQTPQTERYLYTQVGLLKSRPVAARAMERLEPQRLQTFNGVDMPAEFIRKHMQIDVGRKDEIISVSFRSAYASEAAEIVNGVVDAYMTSRSEHGQESSVQVLTILQEQMAQTNKELEEKRHALIDLQTRSAPTGAGSNQGEGVMRRYLAVQDAYVQAKLKMLDADELLASIRALSKDPIALRRYVRSKESPDAYSAADQERTPLETRMVDLELKRGNSLEKLTPDHPRIADMASEIEQIRARLSELDDRFVTASTDAAEQQYAEAKNRLEKLAPLLEEQEKQAQTSNAEATQFQWLRSDVDTLMAHRQTLDEKIRQIQTMIDEDAGQLRMAILEPAAPAEVPSAPQKAKILAAALMLGLLIGGTIASLREWLNHSLCSVEEISALLHVPILGVIPAMRRRRKFRERGQRVRLQPYSPEAEAFRTVRTALLFGAPKDGVKTLLITSPSRRDGKSTLVSNLAIAMAQARQKTLVIDADFRKPVQHTIFEVDHQELCLGSVLAGTMELGAAIQRTRVEGLHLLTCGHSVSHPAELLNSRRFASVLRHLARVYDRILIDAPPVIVVTDAQIIGALADATVLVVKADACTSRAAQRAEEALQSVGARLLGVVINDVRKTGDRYGCYFGRYRRHQSSDSNSGQPSELKKIAMTGAAPATLAE